MKFGGLTYEHTIPEGEEAVLILNRRLIQLQNLFPADEGGYEHYKRAFGQVKIGDERIYALEFVGWIYKYGGVAATWLYRAVGLCSALQRAHGSGADGYHPPALALCTADNLQIIYLS